MFTHFFGIFSFFQSSLVFGQEVLNCNFNNYSNAGYSETMAKSWVPQIQNHNINMCPAQIPPHLSPEPILGRI